MPNIRHSCKTAGLMSGGRDDLFLDGQIPDLHNMGLHHPTINHHHIHTYIDRSLTLRALHPYHCWTKVCLVCLHAYSHNHVIIMAFTIDVLIIEVTAACNQRLHSQCWLAYWSQRKRQDVKMGGGGKSHMHGVWILVAK